MDLAYIAEGLHDVREGRGLAGWYVDILATFRCWQTGQGVHAGDSRAQTLGGRYAC
jgi:hypothetical protein